MAVLKLLLRIYILLKVLPPVFMEYRARGGSQVANITQG